MKTVPDTLEIWCAAISQDSNNHCSSRGCKSSPADCPELDGAQHLGNLAGWRVGTAIVTRRGEGLLWSSQPPHSPRARDWAVATWARKGCTEPEPLGTSSHACPLLRPGTAGATTARKTEGQGNGSGVNTAIY